MTWDLDELVKNNKGYDMSLYAPDLFLFGSEGGGMALAIEKSTGHIQEIPFIGISKEEAVLRAENLIEFSETLYN